MWGFLYNSEAIIFYIYVIQAIFVKKETHPKLHKVLTKYKNYDKLCPKLHMM